MENIVIGGASGAVGAGLVRHCLSKGHQVVAVVRNEAKKRQLQAELGDESWGDEQLHFVVNAFGDETQITHLQQHLQKWGRIDVAIASLGGWHHGPPLHQLPGQDWNTAIANSLTSHFHFAKALMPLLEKQRDGMYAMINGGAAEYPVPHSGVISVMAAAQKMMGQVLHQEAKAYGVQVVGVAAFALVHTSRTAGMDGLWLSAEGIAAYVLGLAQNPAPATSYYWHKLQSPEDLILNPKQTQ